MSGWQPIETAPDWTEVIVLAPTEKPPVFTAMKFDGEWQRQSGGIRAMRDDYFGDPVFHPTRWMPLPDA